jgi:hypothetical protein
MTLLDIVATAATPLTAHERVGLAGAVAEFDVGWWARANGRAASPFNEKTDVAGTGKMCSPLYSVRSQ